MDTTIDPSGDILAIASEKITIEFDVPTVRYYTAGVY